MTKSPLLIHICCAPCLCYPYHILKEKYNLRGFWYNLNIHPSSEYQQRLNTLYAFQIKTGMEMHYEDQYDIKSWLHSVELKNKYDKPLRCISCYKTRLNRTAEYAKKNNYSAFTTTLLYSKFQYHDQIKQIGNQIAEKHNITFLYEDFRKGWKQGIELSHKYKLYRQKYCGCIFSESDS